MTMLCASVAGLQDLHRLQGKSQDVNKRRQRSRRRPTTCSAAAEQPMQRPPPLLPAKLLLRRPPHSGVSVVRWNCPPDAFAECSADVHSLLSDTVSSAAEQCWREARATSARAAQSVYTAKIYRRRWGCETALQGARMKLSRAYLVSGVDDGGAPRGWGRPTFDPRDPDHFAAAASPVLRGTPAGQRN